MNVITHCSKTPEDDVEIRVVHFLIGCKTNPETKGGIIHEFPKLVRTLLTSPEILFDSNMVSYAHHKKVIRIHQVLYLIDPLYRDTEPIFTSYGIKELSDNGTNILNCGEYIVISTIEMFIVPRDTNSEEMNTLIYIAKTNPDTLINIQDTTSSNMCKHTSNSRVHILPSDCFLNTSAKYACPAIAFTDKPRWVNINDDAVKLLTDTYAGDEYVLEYLKAIADFTFFKTELVALSRLWSLCDLNEDVHHIIKGGIHLREVTSKTYWEHYHLFVRPYVEYRCAGNMVFDQILKFLELWYEKYRYIDESPEIPIIDIIKDEVNIRLEMLKEKECTVHKDLVNIISKHAN